MFYCHHLLVYKFLAKSKTIIHVFCDFQTGLLLIFACWYIFKRTQYSGFQRSHEYSTYVNKNKENSAKVVTPIYFLKIFKTGSTTLSNILLRYALRNNFSLPSFKFGTSFPFKDLIQWLFPIKTCLPHLKSCPVLELCLKKCRFSRENVLRENQCQLIDRHTIFNESAVNELMGSNVEHVVGIRHPFTQFQSLAGEFSIWRKLRLQQATTDPFSLFLESPQLYEQKVKIPIELGKIMHVGKRAPTYSNWMTNFMSFSFGYKPYHSELYEDETTFLKRIRSLFPNVVILEELTQSLVLLRRRLGLDTTDIISLKRHTTKSEAYTGSYKRITPENTKLIEAHRNWSRLDYKLYDMFLEEHKYQVKKYGKNFEEEVDVVNEINQQISSFCESQGLSEANYETVVKYNKRFSTEITIPQTPFTNQFNVSAADCIIMNLEHRVFGIYLRYRQFPEICDTVTQGQLNPYSTEFTSCPPGFLDQMAELLENSAVIRTTK